MTRQISPKAPLDLPDSRRDEPIGQELYLIYILSVFGSSKTTYWRVPIDIIMRRGLFHVNVLLNTQDPICSLLNRLADALQFTHVRQPSLTIAFVVFPDQL